MIPFVCWVLALVSVFVVFRLFDRYGVSTFEAIVINYLVCALTGASLLDASVWATIPDPLPTWVWLAFLIGGFFIATFYVLGRSTQVAGVVITTLAGRVSFFIPALANLWLFERSARPWDAINYSGILLAMVAVVLAAYRPGMKVGSWRLPLLVFLISGAIDTMLNYVSLYHLPAAFEGVFSVLLFGTAFGVGVVLLLLRHLRGIRLRWSSVAGGVALGLPNYFSIYLMLVTLRAFGGDGAVVFPSFNVAVIGVSALVSLFLFNEALSPRNWLGIVLAIVSVGLISYQALFLD